MIVCSTHIKGSVREMGGMSEQTYLFAFVVNVYSECRILLLEPVERPREVRGLSTGRFDGQRNDGIGYEHGCLHTMCLRNPTMGERTRRLAYHGIIRIPIGESVPRSTLDAKDCTNLARTNLINVLDVPSACWIFPLEKERTSISLLCMRTSLGTLILFPERPWKINWPLFKRP